MNDMDRRLHVAVRSSPPSVNYHLAIACIGFEDRCVFVPEELADSSANLLAISFDTRHKFNFEANKLALSALGYTVVEVSDWGVADVVTSTLKEVVATRQEGETINVALDCTSFSRIRIAAIFSALNEFTEVFPIELDVFYAPAKFSPYVTGGEAIRIAEPVSYEYSGWASDPEAPVSAIIGVGYEQGRATGVVEYLDAPSVYLFAPMGVDQQYDDAVSTANVDFLSSYPATAYDVKEPNFLYARLESLSYGLRRSSRVNIVPLGPKIFAACALLVSLASEHEITVWRFSGDIDDMAVNREAAGFSIVLSVRLWRED